MNTNASTFDLSFDVKPVGDLPDKVANVGGGRPANPKLDALAAACKEQPGVWFQFASVPHVTTGDKRLALRLSGNLRTGMNRRGLLLAQRTLDNGNIVNFYACYRNGTSA